MPRCHVELVDRDVARGHHHQATPGSAPGGELPQELAFGHGCRAVGGLLDGEEPLVLIAAVQPDRVLVSPFAKTDLLPASGRLDLLCHHPVITGVVEEVDLLGDVPGGLEAGRRDDRAAQDDAAVPMPDRSSCRTGEQELHAEPEDLVLVDIDEHRAVVMHYIYRRREVNVLAGHGTDALATDLQECLLVRSVDQPAWNARRSEVNTTERVVPDGQRVALHGSDTCSRVVELKSPFTRIFYDLNDSSSSWRAPEWFEGVHVVYGQPAVGVSLKSPGSRAMSAHVHQELAEFHKMRMGPPSGRHGLGRHGYGLHDPILRDCCTI